MALFSDVIGNVPPAPSRTAVAASIISQRLRSLLLSSPMLLQARSLDGHPRHPRSASSYGSDAFLPTPPPPFVGAQWGSTCEPAIRWDLAVSSGISTCRAACHPPPLQQRQVLWPPAPAPRTTSRSSGPTPTGPFSP